MPCMWTWFYKSLYNVFISSAQESRCRSKNCKHCIDYQPLTKLQMMLESEHVAVFYMHLTRWFASFESLLSLNQSIVTQVSKEPPGPTDAECWKLSCCSMLQPQGTMRTMGIHLRALNYCGFLRSVIYLQIRLDRLSKWFWHVLTCFCEWQVLYCTPFFSHLRKSNPSIIVLSLPTMASSSSRSLKKACLGLFAYDACC